MSRGRLRSAKRIPIPRETREHVWCRDGGRCGKCGVRCLRGAVAPDRRRLRGAIDHITPVSRGGSNRALNLRLLCTHCNSKKHTQGREFYRSDRLPSAPPVEDTACTGCPGLFASSEVEDGECWSCRTFGRLYDYQWPSYAEFVGTLD